MFFEFGKVKIVFVLTDFTEKNHHAGFKGKNNKLNKKKKMLLPILHHTVQQII